VGLKKGDIVECVSIGVGMGLHGCSIQYRQQHPQDKEKKTSLRD